MWSLRWAQVTGEDIVDKSIHLIFCSVLKCSSEKPGNRKISIALVIILFVCFVDFWQG